MPPKKKAQPLPLPLIGCDVALSGTFPGVFQGEIHAQLATLGATLAKAITDDTTHLITNQRDYEKPSSKVKAALERNLHIVSYDWVQECLVGKSKVSEKAYLLTSVLVDVPSQSNGALKREPSPDVSTDENVRRPRAKKLKSANGSKTDVKTVATAKAEPKVKAEVTDGQVAKSLDIKIPVDEGCHLINYEVYIGDDGIIYDASLNQANATANNNKFYRIQVSATLKVYFEPC